MTGLREDGIFFARSENATTDDGHTKNWPDLAIDLYDRLTGRNGEITVDLEDMHVPFPRGTGPHAEHAEWVLTKEPQFMQEHVLPVALLRSLQEALDQCADPCPMTHDRFDLTHEHFECSSDQQRQILAWLERLVRFDCTSHDPLRILSVGCGSGILDNPLIKSIAACSRRLEYLGVDPNGVACGRFQDSFETMGLGNVSLDLREQCVESLDSSDQFDVIHAVHSLYYFPNPAATLDYLLGLLAPEGKLVVIQAPHAELNRLANCFWSQHAGDRIWFSDRLTRHLSDRRLPFTKERIDGWVDVSPCFQAGCPRGEMMLDFITQSDCRQLNHGILQLCLGYLRLDQSPEGGSTVGGSSGRRICDRST